MGVLGSLTPEELEKLKEAVDERKKLIATLKGKPWPMRKKLVILRYVTAVFYVYVLWSSKCQQFVLCLRESQEFVEKYEGALGKGKGRKLYAYKVMMMKVRR